MPEFPCETLLARIDLLSDSELWVANSNLFLKISDSATSLRRGARLTLP